MYLFLIHVMSKLFIIERKIYLLDSLVICEYGFIPKYIIENNEAQDQ